MTTNNNKNAAADIANNLLNDKKFMQSWHEKIDEYNKKYQSLSKNIEKAKLSLKSGSIVSRKQDVCKIEGKIEHVEFDIFVNNCIVGNVSDLRFGAKRGEEKIEKPMRFILDNLPNKYIDCTNVAVVCDIVREILKDERGVEIMTKIMSREINKSLSNSYPGLSDINTSIRADNDTKNTDDREENESANQFNTR